MRLSPCLAILIIFTSLACIDQTACDPPYSLINGECCLDEDSDGICDRDKPVCSKPYINVGARCCLDLNDNMICDEDEMAILTTTTTIAAKATTLSTSTTTSTLAPKDDGVQCVRVEDCPPIDEIRCDQLGRQINTIMNPIMCREGICVYGGQRHPSSYVCPRGQTCITGVGCVDEDAQNTDDAAAKDTYDFDNIVERISQRSAEPTPVTYTTLKDCIVSDGGIRPYERADEVSGIWWLNGSFIRTHERCADDKTLVEYYCASGLLNRKLYECPSRCMGGRCCKTEGNVCSFDDECCSGICVFRGLMRYCGY